eukprot:549051-Prymnesium_polylepis.2
MWEFHEIVLAQPGNSVCADCNRPGVSQLTWASTNLGVVLCNECVGGHRDLGAHISKPLSLKMDDWSASLKAGFLMAGNSAANAVYEAHANCAKQKPTPDAEIAAKYAFVRAKYATGAFREGGDGRIEQISTSTTAAKIARGQVHAGIIIVRVLCGINLPQSQIAGVNRGKLSEPYVKLKSCGKKVKTKVAKSSRNPRWNESLQLNIDDQAEPISVEVMDHSKLMNNHVIGTASIRLEAMRPMENTVVTLDLENAKGAGKAACARESPTNMYWDAAAIGQSGRTNTANEAEASDGVRHLDRMQNLCMRRLTR